MENQSHKKILSLDGGGIKGAMTLGLLKKAEEIIREKKGPDAKLNDYFDLMGGTSTGSIIASGLAIGYTIERLKEKYFTLGSKIFGHKSCWNFLFKGGFFTASALKKQLRDVFQDRKLSDESIKTYLAIFAKRIDTQSLWTIHNNPNHKYWKYQKDYFLRESIRASTAAPTYFASELIDIKNNGSQIGHFIDGGLSNANNPALNLFLLATVPAHGYNWATGKDNLSVFSFGTGRSISAEVPTGLFKNLKWAMIAPQVLMEDISEQNERVLTILSHANHPRHFDRTVGAYEGVHLTDEPLLNYYRYNIDFSQKYLNEKLGYSFDEKMIKNLRAMDNPKYVETLFEIGYKAAGQIDPDHFV